MSHRLVIMGPQGSGKGTQAALLADRLGIPTISTGDLFRAHMAAQDDLGELARSYTSRGELVPDEVTNAMVRRRLSEPDVADGFILDGYPRNLAQANALDTLLARLHQPVDVAVQLDVDTELLIERLAGRAQVEGRADDTPEAVRNRLKIYNEATAPVVEFYRQSGRLVHLDGVGTMDEVFQRIVEALAPTPDVG